jgi:opacity protein-like surface antigen
MKKFLNTSGILALAVGLAASPALAMAPGTMTEKEHTTYAIGADLVGQLPVGDFADAASFGLGALLRGEYQLDQSPLGLTLRTGYIYYLEETAPFGSGEIATQFSRVPILGGLKYSLKGAPVYIGAEAGVSINMSKVEITGAGPFNGEESETEAQFAWGAGAGYELGPVDIRVGLDFADGANPAESMAVAVSFGYNFVGM